MEKVLFISNRINNKGNGAFIAAKRNLDNLKQLNYYVEVYEVPNIKFKIKQIFNIFFRNRLEEITPQEEEKILKKLNKEKYNYIFFDGSSFGYLSDKIKKIDNNIKILTFCHDVNYYLYSALLEILKKDWNYNLISYYRYFLLKKLRINAIINENKIFRNSDIVITFNKRDSELLYKKYNKISDQEIPMSFFQKNKLNFLEVKNKNQKLNLLFVGASHHTPNLEGIKFFIEKVIPLIDVELVIVGKGMEKYKKNFEERNNKIKVIGTVENLDNYYLNADAVISPIFSGGGMKIKTGEALSYGKTIFGTSEAFEGYEIDYKKVGGLCNNAEEFIKMITDYIICWEKNGKVSFNSYSYNIFKKKYSYEASLEKFKKVFKIIKDKK